MPIISSSPAKILIMGDHAVVHGFPAILSSLNVRSEATIHDRKDDQIEVLFQDQTQSLSLNEVLLLFKEAERKYQIFFSSFDNSCLKQFTNSPHAFIFLCIAVVLSQAEKIQKRTSGFSISITSTIPIGSGLGSSASVASAICAGLHRYFSLSEDRESIFNSALRCETFAHGKPSGGDVAACLHGGLVWFQKESETSRTIKPISKNVPQNIQKNLHLIQTGKPAESTAEMIAHVRSQLQTARDETMRALQEIETVTRLSLRAFENQDVTQILECLQKDEHLLEKLGVVSEKTRGFIRAVEKSGGFAKISGGGGMKEGAGVLMVYHTDKKKLESMTTTAGFTFVEARCDTRGTEVVST